VDYHLFQVSRSSSSQFFLHNTVCIVHCVYRVLGETEIDSYLSAISEKD